MTREDFEKRRKEFLDFVYEGEELPEAQENDVTMAFVVGMASMFNYLIVDSHQSTEAYMRIVRRVPITLQEIRDEIINKEARRRAEEIQQH